MRSPVALTVVAAFGRIMLVLSLLAAILILFTSLYVTVPVGTLPSEPFITPSVTTERVINWAAALIAGAVALQGLILWAMCEAIAFIGETVIDIYDTLTYEQQPLPDAYGVRRVPVIPGTPTRVRIQP